MPALSLKQRVNFLVVVLLTGCVIFFGAGRLEVGKVFLVCVTEMAFLTQSQFEATQKNSYERGLEEP